LTSSFEKVYRAASNILVDLYDDQGLAELLSLDTVIGSDPRPRYTLDPEYEWGFSDQGRCLNCERAVFVQGMALGYLLNSTRSRTSFHRTEILHAILGLEATMHESIEVEKEPMHL